MKRILLMAGGTATAWHIANTIRSYFTDRAELHVCDTNPKELVPASQISDKFHQVQEILSPYYLSNMCELILSENIDLLIPLIDYDLRIFSPENLEKNQILADTTGPQKAVFDKLTDKKELFHTLKALNIPALKVFEIDEVNADEEYIVKPRIGFGSRNIRLMKGTEIKSENYEDIVIQEICEMDNMHHEITAEVYNFQGIRKIFMRSRVETKQGVCTKCRPIYVKEVEESINKLLDVYECPIAFCIQFLYGYNKWHMNDVNLRPGAGTGMSSAMGFELVRAMIGSKLDNKVHQEWLKPDFSIQSVCRVYNEVVMR